MLAALALSIVALGDPSSEVILKCRQSLVQSDPRTPEDFYGTPPPGLSRERFVSDIWKHGLIALAVAPAESWVLDFEGGRVTEVGSGFRPLEFLELSASRLLAETPAGVPLRSADFNRVTGHMTLIVGVSDVSSWNEEFGSDLSPYRLWELDCEPATRRF